MLILINMLLVVMLNEITTSLRSPKGVHLSIENNRDESNIEDSSLSSVNFRCFNSDHVDINL